MKLLQELTGMLAEGALNEQASEQFLAYYSPGGEVAGVESYTVFESEPDAIKNASKVKRKIKGSDSVLQTYSMCEGKKYVNVVCDYKAYYDLLEVVWVCTGATAEAAIDKAKKLFEDDDVFIIGGRDARDTSEFAEKLVVVSA